MITEQTIGDYLQQHAPEVRLNNFTFYIFNQDPPKSPVQVDLDDYYDADELYLFVCPNNLQPTDAVNRFPELLFPLNPPDGYEVA